MQLCNIFPVNMIGPDMPRQSTEMYLTHKILEHPEKFAFLADDKANGIRSFKILDNSACELGEGLDFAKVLQAAEIIGADEVVLPDLPRRGTSLAYTLQYLATLPDTLPYKIAAVAQGETQQEVVDCIAQILSIKRIDTIMIPKHYCSMQSSNGLGRIAITGILLDIMQKRAQGGAKLKAIHWLGLDTGIRELITPLAPYVRSVDTGYFTALATPEWSELSVAAERPRELVIDLESMDVDMERLAELMRQQTKLLNM